MPQKLANPASACAETGPGVFCLAAVDTETNTATNKVQQASSTVAIVDAGTVVAIVAGMDAARAFLVGGLA